MRICNCCFLERPLSDFGKNAEYKDGIKKKCKPCESVYRKAYYYKNRERNLQINQAWRDNNKEYNKNRYLANKEQVREYSLIKEFGINNEQYSKMLESQNSRCLICETHQNDLTKKMAVDHCHKTGRIRGLLCQKCNVGIGLLKDDIALLKKAIDYLIK